MTLTTRLTHSALAAAILAVACAPAHAVKYGQAPSTAPGAPAIVNPFTGQQTDVWKLVGYLGCSGFQITREWVVQAGHCGIAPTATATFSNHLGSSPVLGSDCQGQAGYDFQLCRLKNPENLAPFPRYPALAVMVPNFNHQGSAKYGSLMGYGRSGYGDGLAFTGFDGLPYGYNPALVPTTPAIPFPVEGDSGGAAYWFSPTATEPVMVGVLVGGTTLDRSPLYFNQANLDWIKQIIVGRGDPAPVTLTTAQNFTDPGGEAPPPLSAPPVLKGSGASLTLSWTTPTATPAVSSFEVTLGKGGALDRQVSVAAGTGNTLSLNNLATTQYIACVRPKNSVGLASAAFPSMVYPKDQPSSAWYIITQTPNCTTVDNRLTQATVSGLTATGPTLVAGLYKVAFNWSAATPVPADLPIRRYRVTQTTRYPTGPVRVASTEVSATTAVASVIKGSQVCLDVAALTDTGQVGPRSAPVCKVAP
jgi:hypothetical protein